MLVQQLILDNIEEIAQADRLALPLPPSKFISRKMVMNIDDITLAYVNRENNIEILIDGQFYEIEYKEDIWDTIKNAISERQNA